LEDGQIKLWFVVDKQWLAASHHHSMLLIEFSTSVTKQWILHVHPHIMKEEEWFFCNLRYLQPELSLVRCIITNQTLYLLALAKSWVLSSN